MNSRANRLANWLRDGAGIQKGDRVAILAHDGVEHLDLFFACGKLGAIHVPLNWRLHWRETLDLIRDTTPTVLVFSDEFREAAQHIANSADCVQHVLHIDGEGLRNSRYFEKILMDSTLRPVTTESVTEIGRAHV